MVEDDVERQVEKPRPADRGIHAVFYVASWIFFSNLTILFNKWIIDSRGFRYPVILTCWHLIFATIATQVLARTTTLLDGRKNVKMTGRLYLRAIVPIGLLYSASLVCSNMVYLYLSVAFIQMLKAAAPVAVLLTSWAWGVEDPSLKRFINVLLIVAGVALASFGEIDFSVAGFLFQVGGIVFEAVRLVMIQVLLSGDTQKMDPLVSLYYYAPICAVMNVIIAIGSEANKFDPADLAKAGYGLLLLNAAIAFLLNVSSVFLIGKTSGLVMTLTGILKNILLVIISVMIWHTNITWLQCLGYTIALAGLLYYSLGWDQIVLLSQAAWVFVAKAGGDFTGSGAEQQQGGLPAAVRRTLVMGVAAFLVLFLVGAFFYGGGVAGAVGEQLGVA
ncbi:triose-phosphate transporter family-domain-containing protein [Chaetomium sp. MPI-SDFR-AT-0129]|uniref:Triose-phosphate transporter family-domain-containing protein n=1 Tax=Dichotomopilus funicola TaxID=1934379 RepID=A0AAN6ZNN8_9PEZI|nr:triose-phosphate transporter family-domain-containing protein [Chaetomium sp. MPI-SDFR-AT-0129]KAK4143751.1 triose-phosphate transporter family-domain-containing protein [Dichotomopilus funicola]